MPSYDTNTDRYVSHHERPGHDGAFVFETHTLFETIGDVRGKTVMDLCCGTGRLTYTLLAMGAASVVGVDVSAQMIARAEAQRQSLPRADRDRVRFVRADLNASDLALEPVDIVTGLYVLHYADTPTALEGMGRFIARHMKPDGTCALVTMNPDMDALGDRTAAQAETGVYLDRTDGPASTLRVNGFSCPVWLWPRALQEGTLAEVGLTGFTWTGRDVPPDRPDLKARYAEAIRRPHCVVFTARRAAPAQPLLHEQMLMMV